MSKVAIVGDVLGTGTFTLKAPNGNTDRTLDLPDNTGTVITTASTFAGTGPAFSAVAGSATALSAATTTKINFSTEQWDTNNCYDTSTSRFTPNVAGYYQISSTIRADFSNTILHVYVRKNGTDVLAGNLFSVTSSQNASTVSGLVSCNGTTDYIEIGVFSASAGNTATGFQVSFQGVLVRAA